MSIISFSPSLFLFHAVLHTYICTYHIHTYVCQSHSIASTLHMHMYVGTHVWTTNMITILPRPWKAHDLEMYMYVHSFFSLHNYIPVLLHTSASVAIASAASAITPSVWKANTHSSRVHTQGCNKTTCIATIHTYANVQKPQRFELRQ